MMDLPQSNTWFQPTNALLLISREDFLVGVSLDKIYARKETSVYSVLLKNLTINRMKQTERSLEQKLGRSPTDDELANALDKTVEKIQYMKIKDQKPKSLEEPIGEEEDREFGFGLEDITEET